MTIQTELTRITNAKAAIKTAIEGKGVTVPAGTLLDGMATLIESIEAGGGGGNSWTDNYTVFATGTFTPVENTTEMAIDTGVPFHTIGEPYFFRQILIGWREPNATTIAGCSIFEFRGFTEGHNTTPPEYSLRVFGSSVGIPVAKSRKSTQSPFPKDGDSVWNINGLDAGTNFRAGKPYRWMLLGVLK